MSNNKQPKPNDQRSTVKNPNNEQHAKDLANQEKQKQENLKKQK